MRNLLLLLFTLLLFISCSTDESSERDPEVDPIIGTWAPVTFAQFPVNGDPIIESIGECGRKTRIIFKANGDLINNYFGQDQGECTSDTYYQTWERLSSGTYIFIETETDENGESTTYTTSPDEISFPDSNTLRIIYNNDYDQETELNYWYNEFKRQ